MKLTRQDELSHRRRKAGEESIERVVARNHTVHELQHAHHDQEAHKHVNQLRPLRRLVQVALPYPQGDFVGRLVGGGSVRGFGGKGSGGD